MKKISSKIQIKVPFYDLDPMNIVWHGNYVKYLEKARCALFAKLNYTYYDMYDDNIMYPLAKMDFKFIKSAKFDDDLEIEATFKEFEPAIIIKYDIFSGEDKILSASTMQMGVNVKTGETIYNAPEKLLKAVEEYDE